MKQILAEKAAAILATRTEAAGKIEALKKERGEVIPKLIEDRDAKEERFKEAKAALDTVGGEFQAARGEVSSQSQSFDHAISRQEMILLESSDPALGEVITFFREKLDWLRDPIRISTDHRRGETNIFTEKVTLTVASNIDAINSAMAYCRAAIMELESMKLAPAMDAEKIAALKEGVPRIDDFTESTREKPMPGSKGMPMIRPRFGGAASDEYEQTLLDRVHKKANDFLRK